MTFSLAYFKLILNLHILLGGISVDSCQPLEPAMVGARTRNASQQSKLFSVIFPKKIYNQRPRITYLAIKIWFPIFRTNFGTNQQEVHVENRFWKLIFLDHECLWPGSGNWQASSPVKNLRTMFVLKFTGKIKIYAKSILKSVHPEKEFV